MTKPVTTTPALPGAPSTSVPGLVSWSQSLTKTLYNILTDFALRLNSCLTFDGGINMIVPFPLMSSIVADLPNASTQPGGLLYVSNESGGATLAFSDGTNWRRVQDRNIVS